MCNHPVLLDDPEEWPPVDELVAASGKLEARRGRRQALAAHPGGALSPAHAPRLQVLDRLLAALKAGGHRCVIFSQFTTVLDMLGHYLTERGHKHSRLDGHTNRVQRAIDAREFCRAGSDTFIFLLSTRAGGLGLNLQAADTCIIYDSDWHAPRGFRPLRSGARARPKWTLVSEGLSQRCSDPAPSAGTRRRMRRRWRACTASGRRARSWSTGESRGSKGLLLSCKEVGAAL